MLAVIPFIDHAAMWLEAVAVAIVIVQALDAAIGLSIRDPFKTIGPASTAVANLAALIWMLHTQ